MLIFLIPIILLLSCMGLSSVGDLFSNGRHGTQFGRWCFRHTGAWSVSSFFSIFALILMLLFLIGNRIDYASFPAQYKSVKVTLNTARTDFNAGLERAAILHKVVDMNKEIATVKYWNGSVWIGWFWPGKVAELEYIK